MPIYRHKCAQRKSYMGWATFLKYFQVCKNTAAARAESARHIQPATSTQVMYSGVRASFFLNPKIGFRGISFDQRVVRP